MPTLGTLRQAFGERLGRWQLSATSGIAGGAEPARWIYAHQTTNTGGFRNDGAEDGIYVGDWIGLVSGAISGQVRRIIHTIPSQGLAAVDHPWSAAVAISVTFEHSWPLPLARQGDVPGLNEFLVQAMRDLWTTDRIDVTTVADQQSYSLSAQADWLDRPERILGVYDPPPAANWPRIPSAIGWELVLDGGTPTLVSRYDAAYPGSGFTFQVEVMRPIYSLVSGSESTTGPTSSSETVLGQTSDIVTVAMLRACRWLSRWDELTDAQQGHFAVQIPGLQAEANALAHYLPRAEGVGGEMKEAA